MDENKGEVVGLNEGRGFGFLKVEGRRKDLFFHAQQLIDADFKSLKKGDILTFEGIEPTHKGDQAFGLRVA